MYVTSPNIRKYFICSRPGFEPCNGLIENTQRCCTGLGLLHKIITIHCFVELIRIWIIIPVYCTHALTTAQALFIVCAKMAIGEGLYNHCDQLPVDQVRGKWSQPWIKILVIRKWFSPWFEQRNWLFFVNKVFSCYMSIRHIRHVLAVMYFMLSWCSFHVLRYLEVSKNVSFTMKVSIVMARKVAIVT